MLRSMYAGVAGMKGFQTKLDVIGNNISNVNTVGFKKSRVNFQDLLSQNLSDSSVNPMQVGLGSGTSSIDVIHTAGSQMTTGISSNLSLIGNGFFVVQKGEADVGEAPQSYLTRTGNFVVNSDGQLVTSQGYSVLGVNNLDGELEDRTFAPIQINPELYDSYIINRSGEVIGKSVDGDAVLIANIGVVSPANPAGLRKAGGSLFEMTAAAAAGGNGSLGGMNEAGVFEYDVEIVQTAKDAKTEITSGQLEMSNVDLTEEFTEMIVAQRGFQANSRLITTSDEILQEVVNLKR